MTLHSYILSKIKIHFTKALVAGLFTTILTSTAYADYRQQNITYRITVTNITTSIQFTPIVAAAHTSRISFFEVGQPASSELVAIAESGSIDAFQTALHSNNQVSGISNSEGLFDTGASVTFDIDLDRRVGQLSMAAMLLPTNDTLVLHKISSPEAYRAVCKGLHGIFTGSSLVTGKMSTAPYMLL